MLKISAKEYSQLKKAGKIRNVTQNSKKTIDTSDNLSLTKGRHELKDYTEESIVIDVNIDPQPKERARTFMNDKVVVSAFIQSSGDVKKFMSVLKSNTNMKTLTPESTRNFEKMVGIVASSAMSKACRKPFTCPVFMHITIKIKGNDNELPTGHKDGDLDNHEKAIKDAINKIVYEDDRLVVAKIGVKICSSTPGITMKITPISNSLLSSLTNNSSY